MSSRTMKLDEIKARAQAAFETSEQRKRDAMQAWQALEDQGNQMRLKTERLKALRLAKEAQEAEDKSKADAEAAVAVAAKPVRKRVSKSV